MSQLPPGAPVTPRDAYAHINAVTHPTLDDLKLMVFLEAAGEATYANLAKAAPNAEVAALLQANGREEVDHALRVCAVIKRLHGVDFAPPSVEENPLAGGAAGPITAELLEGIVRGENNGCALYLTWAANTADPEAAALLTRNAHEETLHGARAEEAMALI
jgi:rubrerythrin